MGDRCWKTLSCTNQNSRLNQNGVVSLSEVLSYKKLPARIKQYRLHKGELHRIKWGPEWIPAELLICHPYFKISLTNSELLNQDFFLLSTTLRHHPGGARPERGEDPSQRSGRRGDEVGPAQQRLGRVAAEAGAGSGPADGAPGGRGPAGRTAEAGRDGEGGLGTCRRPADRLPARAHRKSQGQIVFSSTYDQNTALLLE